MIWNVKIHLSNKGKDTATAVILTKERAPEGGVEICRQNDQTLRFPSRKMMQDAIPTNPPERSPEDVITEILSRWSVTDLREMNDDDLDRGLLQVGDKLRGVKTIRSGVVNLIRFWDIESNSGATYQVRRFENFVWCSCLDHFFKKTACRHIAATTKDFNRSRNREIDRSPYLKGGSDSRPERVGSVRI